MLHVVLETPSEVAWGERLCGEVVLEPAPAAVQVTTILVILAGVPQDPAGDAHLFPVCQELRGLWRIQPGMARHVPFAVRVPWRAFERNYLKVAARVTWRQRVARHRRFPSSAVYSPDREQKAERTLTLLQPMELTQLAGAVGEVTGTRFYGWQERPKADGVRAVFRPGDWEGRTFDEVILDLPLRRGSGRRTAYVGQLLLNLREQTPADHLRATFGGNTASLDVTLRPGDPDGLRRHLAERLAAFMDRSRSLPLPAHPPAPAAETLPRPSTAPDEEVIF